MKILCFITCVLLLLFSIAKKMKIYNPSIILYGIWFFILLFNLLSLYEINKASSETYFCIFIGLLFFFIGTLAQDLSRTDNVRFKFGKTSIARDVEINYKLIYFLATIVIILALIDFVISVSYIFSGYSLTQIRSWKFETYDTSTNPLTSRRSFIEQTIRVIFAAPFETALLPIALIDFFQNNKKTLFILEIILLIINMISGGGGRLGILTLIIMIIMVIAIYKNKVKEFVKKINKKLVIGGIIGVAVIIYFTIQRSGSSIWEEVYYYLALCVPLLDYWLPKLERGPHTYGMMFLYGITRIPCMVFEKIGLGNWELYNLAQEYILQANTFKDVGARVANSFVTPFYYLYVDAGIFGIILGMFLFGYFSEKYFLRVQRGNRIQDIYIFLLIIRGIVYTFMRWDFISTNYAVAYLFVFLFFKKVHKKEVSKKGECG